MKKIFILSVMFVFCACSVFAASYYDSVDQIKEFNPDGKKYEFVRDFIHSLSYLQANDDRSKKISGMSFDKLDNVQKGRELISGFVKDNANIRVAKNLLKKYISPENGLMLKVTDLFTEVCDELIVINKSERQLLQDFQEIQEKQELESFDGKEFRDRQRKLASIRRDSLKKLFEASMLVTKVLVSNKEDRFDQLTMLGITSQERKKLLEKLDKFYSKEFDGSLKEGQSFLQASVAVIRDVLMDTTWGLLDD
ncbi:MAG: hypothetical protein A2Y03_07665 [Omnitrophica WOR_2 bacterium GWF2_38_59]|nr:MAG: hypothetical protein A2Y03_07665 [Omnitrophica WOR_2 bacterium GWF2_38_59]OGX49445.1 MAG: hypothetical protein A2243_09540 [Omnitrophica WOR_2 bacterium RIFOXYA2_FULL_38_17]OGX57815.1 MAG: hypothetical protein A2447_06960 [Omnitrophica WOR_2 bacterium RIFOXYC2_FULL_38_12]HBG62459.1 hypothetical protein [Candidatus Omnitrophota bacterium]